VGRHSDFDDLGLRAWMSGALVPFLMAALAFLAALALGGFGATAGLARHWQEGARSALTVQVPQPDLPAAPPNQGTRQAGVVSALLATPGIASAHALNAAELADLLRPWLGARDAKGTTPGDAKGDVTDTLLAALPLPGVVQVRLAGSGPDIAALAARLAGTAPGTLVESHGAWAGRLAILALSLQACAALVLLVVAAVAAAMVGGATRSGLEARREAIEIVHGLGAPDGYIAGRFAARAARLAAAGAAAGTLASLPVLLGLSSLAAPLADGGGRNVAAGVDPVWLPPLPAPLWLALVLLPLAAAAIGWLTAQATVRRWLRRLP
jgi:cell division transport system permease protein